MRLPEPVFVGYCPKHLHDPGWDGIRVVCSVSNCISEGASFEEGVPWWTCNRARFYNSVDDALAAAGPQKDEPIVVFAYWIYPITFNDESDAEAIDLLSLFPARSEDFPEAPPTPPWYLVGYDAIALERHDGYPCWGCSPLSCNGYARLPGDADGTLGAVFNQYCLLDSLDAAVEAAKVFQFDQPEPGTYLIVRVEAPTPELQLERPGSPS